MGGHPERLVDLYIETINQAVAECLDDVVIAIHMCRGHLKGRYGAGGYEWPSAFLPRCNVQPLPPYDMKRAGDFARCVSCQKAKAWYLDTRLTVSLLESLDVLKQRTEEATRYVDLTVLPSACNAALHGGRQPLTEADARAKIALVEAAKSIWG